MAGLAHSVEIAAAAFHSGDVLLVNGIEHGRRGAVKIVDHGCPDVPRLIDALLNL